MDRREARRSLGTRRNRRAGTKTKVIPGGGDHKPPKFRQTFGMTRRGRSLLAREKLELKLREEA